MPKKGYKQTEEHKKKSLIFGKMVCQKCHINLQRIRAGQKYCFKCSKEIRNIRTKEWYAKIRQTIIYHYSNGAMKCANCGENDSNALSIDHINGDGARHRKEIGAGRTYKWLIVNNFP